MDIVGWDLKASAQQPDAINLKKLEKDAKKKLAQELGQSVSWLNKNKGEAAKQLASNENSLLADMTDESADYYQLFGGNSFGRAGWWQLFKDLGYAGWWQEYVANDAYGQKAYFSTLAEPTEAQDVPEPSSLLGLGSLIACIFLKRCSIKAQD
ncbi:MAG: PEP-CTERM sorting domain-containing protein [Moorea sp. SIO3C2]|nr:PEP-CTERM sorting domain-containing protein [Moorena sp. SIO3C2]